MPGADRAPGGLDARNGSRSGRCGAHDWTGVRCGWRGSADRRERAFAPPPGRRVEPPPSDRRHGPAVRQGVCHGAVDRQKPGRGQPAPARLVVGLGLRPQLHDAEVLMSERAGQARSASRPNPNRRNAGWTRPRTPMNPSSPRPNRRWRRRHGLRVRATNSAPSSAMTIGSVASRSTTGPSGPQPSRKLASVSVRSAHTSISSCRRGMVSSSRAEVTLCAPPNPHLKADTATLPRNISRDGTRHGPAQGPYAWQSPDIQRRR